MSDPVVHASRPTPGAVPDLDASIRALLLAGRPAAGAALDDPALVAAYAYPVDLRHRWVRANMVATLDGAASGTDGLSGSINTGADRAVFALLRALADVVLVGAGTARDEGYRPLRGPGPRWAETRSRLRPTPAEAAPVLAVVTRSGTLPDLLTEQQQADPEDGAGRGQVLLLTCEAAGRAALTAARGRIGTEAVLVCGEDEVDLPTALGRLAHQGLVRVLCEGGPHLLGDLAAAGLLDELCLTVAPTLQGAGPPRILAGAGGSPRAMHPYALLESAGTLLGRWVTLAGMSLLATG